MATEKKGFFAKAFDDMKKDAAAQHEVDKAQFQAVKAESRALWEEAKLSPAAQTAKRREELKEQLAQAQQRTAEANARVEAARNARQSEKEETENENK